MQICAKFEMIDSTNSGSGNCATMFKTRVVGLSEHGKIDVYILGPFYHTDVCSIFDSTKRGETS